MEIQYHAKTPEDVRHWLDKSNRLNQLIRVFYGDTLTGTVTPEEKGVYGYVRAHDHGPKHPIMTRPKVYRAFGIRDDLIVGIVTRDNNGRCMFVYKHKYFNNGEWSISDCDQRPKVKHNGEVFAIFETLSQAWRYRQFMVGERVAR